jgi:putative inorganic carbon (hco3(-)) transporter
MAAIVEELRSHPQRSPVVFGLGVLITLAVILAGYGVELALLAIAVPIVIAIAIRPQRGILLFCALLPYDGIIKQFAPGFTNPWKQALTLGLLLLTFVCPAEARAQERRKFPGWVKVFGVLVALGLLSAFRVDSQTALIGLRLSYFSALIGWTIWRCPLDRRERDTFVSILIFMGAVTAGVGIWQQMVGHVYLHDLGYAYNDTLRFTAGFTLRSFSTFNLPFPFGFYEMIVILAALPMAMAEPRRLRSKVFFVLLPVLMLGMFFSFVRGAMLGLAVGLLYLAFHRYKVLVYGIPLVLVAALFIPTGAAFTTAVFSSNSLGERTTSWNDRIEHFAENPFGTGIGTTGAAAEKAAKVKSINPNTTYVPDNSWLKEMFELGVIGLWLLAVIIISMFLMIRRTGRRVSGIDQDFVAGAGAQMLAIMTSALVATYFELVPMDQLFWMMVAIVATMAPDLKPDAAVHRPVGAFRRRRHSITR